MISLEVPSGTGVRPLPGEYNSLHLRFLALHH